MKFRLQRSPKFVIVATILDGTQQPSRVFVTSFSPRNFVQIASEEPLYYHSGLWLLFGYISLCQACSKLPSDNIEDNEVHNRLEESGFC